MAELMKQTVPNITIVEILRSRARDKPDNRAYTFLIDGEKEGACLRYADLDIKSRAIAVLLQDCKAKGERALLIYPPGLDFVCGFFGSLYAGVIGIPVPHPNPLRLQRTLPRLQSIARDCNASLVLTTCFLLKSLSETPELKTMRWLATDDVADSMADRWHETNTDIRELAFLQYTSGSTSSPKGVMIGHDNIIHHCAYVSHAWRYTDMSSSITWMPHFHDYALVEGIIHPVYRGIPAFLMSPLDFLMYPKKWLAAISKYRITNSAGPNFAYELCAQKVNPETMDNLNLACWETAGNAAEPVRRETMEKFTEIFAPYGFRRETFCPSYGLAEATLVVSAATESSGPVYCSVEEPLFLQENRITNLEPYSHGARTIVGCGQPVLGVKVAIVHPNTSTMCASDEVGEIWVKDASVARGYWNRVEESQKTFQAYLKDTGDGPFLRTGDLGFLQDGELYITGRLKDMIIIGGENHYPQDIEWRVENCHVALRLGCCAAFSVDIEKEERLIVVAEVEEQSKSTESHISPGSFTTREIKTAIRKTVAEYFDLQVYSVALIRRGTIPKTSSGKIQRHLCREKFLNNMLELQNDDGSSKS